MSAKLKEFYESPEWIAARSKALTLAGHRCERCGNRPRDGYKIEVHHLLPLAKFPLLALAPHNLQVLCRACHMGWHWLEWGIKRGAANDPRFRLDPPRRSPDPQQLALPW